MEDKTGIITTLSPAVVVIYTGDVNPIYALDAKDPGNGLKTLAQTGNVNPLKEALAKMPNATHTPGENGVSFAVLLDKFVMLRVNSDFVLS